MLYRYKITSDYDEFNEFTKFNIRIQRYNKTHMLHWSNVERVELRQVLNKLNPCQFNVYEYYSQIPTRAIYCELSKYQSMDELIMKYITNIVLPREEGQKCEQNYEDMIYDFVLTKKWKTIEIKENED